MKCALILAVLVSLTAAARAAQEPVHIGPGVPPPQKTRDVKPVYPREAQDARVSGVVVIEATVGEDGRVVDAVVLRSIPLLDQAALDAVRQWEFTRTTVNGKAVPVVMTVTVNFALQGVAPVDSVPVGPSASAPIRLFAFGSLVWDIPLDRGAALPHWNLDDNDAPMTIGEARRIARSWLAQRDPQTPFMVQSITLSRMRRSAAVDFWYYQIAFVVPAQQQQTRVFVLPDRSVVEPKPQ